MNSNKMTLTEAQKRFKLLSEYDFYVPEAYHEEADGGLMGEEDPADDEDTLGDAPVDGEDSGDDMGGDSSPEGDDMGDSSDEPMGDDDAFAGEDDGPIDFSGDGGDAAPEADPMAEPAPAAPAEPEVELDVTQLVQSTDAAKQAADMTSQQLSQLTQQFAQLTQKVSQMDGISQQIDKLEHEVEKRNPTEQEKLEMRSLSSYPYNLKLTDYWADKEGPYDVMDNNGQRQEKEKEYVLTQDDVNAGYNANAVRDSFELDDFEEEDI